MKGRNELQKVIVLIGFIIAVIGGLILGSTITNPNMIGVYLIIVGVAIIGIISKFS